ncbi:MAG: hypothetical protein QXY61_02835 [Candidatus Anstonellales archaeon]
MVEKVKVRKQEDAKETENRAGIFERFKDIVERFGNKALIAGVLLGGGVGVGKGFSINEGATSRQDSIKIELEFWLGYVDAFQTFGIDGTIVNPELADEIYKDASTKSDSTTQAINFWLRETGQVPYSSIDVCIMLKILATMDWEDLATFSQYAQRISD